MRLSLATRISLGYAAVLLTFGAVSVFAVMEMRQNQQEIRLVSEGYLHLSQDIAAIETFQRNQERDTARLSEEESVGKRRDMILLARLYYPNRMAQALTEAKERAQQGLAAAPKSEVEFLNDVIRKLAELESRFGLYSQAAEEVYRALETPEPPASTAASQLANLKALESTLGRDVRLLHLSLEGRIRERVSRAEQRVRRTGLAILALSVLAIGVGLLATLLAARTLRPVRTLIDGVSRIGRGDYSTELGLSGEDDIALLAKEFDQMARSLRQREAQLSEKQEALLAAEQLAAVGRISASVAHEVRNPLSSIGLNIELLQDAISAAHYDNPKDQEEAQSLLSAVTREVDRLTGITEQYLNLARPIRPMLQAEDLHQVLESVLEFSRPELEQAEIRVDRQFEAPEAKAFADENQLRQVFLNLIRNSKEAMSGGGILTVGSRSRDGQLELSFSDTGRGMSDDVRRHIFEPFFSTKERGTGLGLSVTQQILQAHGGSIECVSALGNGTTFVLRLPRPT